MLLRTFAALVAGVVLALAFEPFNQPVVVPFCIAAFVLCVRGLGVGRALVPGFMFGVGFMYVLIFWMRVVGPDAWIALATLEAAFYAVLGSVTALVTRLRWWPLWTAAAWVACEVFRSSGTTGWMPWGRVSYAMVDTPVAAAFPWVGGNGTSLLLALLGSTLAWGVLRFRASPRAVALAVAASLVLLLAPSLMTWHSASDGSVTVAAVQGNVPGDGSDILLDFRQVTQNHVDSTVQLADDVAAGRQPRPDFVIWPENSTAVDPFTDAETNAGIWAASNAIGVPILVGAIADAPGNSQVLNQGIVWNPGVGGGDRYTKRHPVAMGEYIPYRNGLLTSMVGRLALVPRDMVAGTRTEPLQIAGTPVADAICFDVAYDDGLYHQVRNGARMIVVQTSNATFIHTTQIEQQFAITRLRAIETGRYVVVAATNGISGVIAPDGSVVSQAAPRTQKVLLEEVALHDEVPPGVILGPWIGRAAILTALLATAFSLVPYRRGRKTRIATQPHDIEVLT
ncbi:apolipoprotein N-acyltransferase [Nocardioides sp.]|uniref:apolipoprotein N-acyltransferase n=1 Tax=Nocardioides sp. TaxID=35761 RepID=UPI003D0CC70A